MRVSTGFGHLTCGIFVVFRRGGIIIQGTELQWKLCASRRTYFTFQLTNYIYFLKRIIMCMKMIYFVSFVLVLGLVGSVSADLVAH